MSTYCVDFETFYDDEVNIERFGAYNYFRHPKSDIYMVSVVGPGISYVGSPSEAPWSQIKGHKIIAHNYSFDGSVLDALGVDLGNDWNCSANLSRYLGVAGALDKAAKKLLGRDIDKAMRDSMKGRYFCELLEFEKQAMRDYALKDAETALALWTSHEGFWPAHEQELSKHTIRMCGAGIGVDLELLDRQKATAERLMEEAIKLIPWALYDSPLSPVRAKERCHMAGIPAPDSFSEDSPDCIAWEEKYGETYSFVKGMRQYRKSNTLGEKLSAIQRRLMPSLSGRLRYDLKYFGAHTGRWSGSGGVNLQNLPRTPFGGIDLRNLFIPSSGKKFIIADLSQIEPRVLAYLAKDEEFLDAIRAGWPIYEAHARLSGVWNGTKGTLKKENPELYVLCKNQRLGLGYGMGARKFRSELEKAGIKASPAQAQQYVNNFRRTTPQIPQLWYRLDRALQAAYGEGEFTMGLPSGRKMRYEYLQRIGDAIYFRQPNGMEVSTWGGKLTENLVSGTARDVFGECILSLDRAGIRVVLHVHDEVICEVDKSVRREEVLEHLTQTPEWLEGCPIGAEAHECNMYTK